MGQYSCFDNCFAVNIAIQKFIFALCLFRKKEKENKVRQEKVDGMGNLISFGTNEKAEGKKPAHEPHKKLAWWDNIPHNQSIMHT